MQIEIVEKFEQIRLVEVDLPYYYKFDLDNRIHSIVYGKVDENLHQSIHETADGSGTITVELLKQGGRDAVEESLQYYYRDVYKSTKDEYEEAKLRATEFLNSLK